MEKFKYQVELVLGVDDVPQPETREHKHWGQNENTKTGNSVVMRGTYLTIFGWLSSLRSEISRMAVLGTPSVSLYEMNSNLLL